MVINKEVIKLNNIFILQVTFFSLKFVGRVFVGTVFVVFITSSRVIHESSIILSTHLTFSQLHAAGFQT